MRAVVTQSFSLVGSVNGHLELITHNNTMATSSCGILNRLRYWKDEQESGDCHFSMCSGRYNEAVGFAVHACAEVNGRKGGKIGRRTNIPSPLLCTA